MARGAKPKRTAEYREMLNNAPNLVKSQAYNQLYAKLLKDDRVDRFVAVVQYCSMQGYNIVQTIEVILKAFPGYINKKEINEGIFRGMLKDYPIISQAWGFGKIGDDISNIIIKNKALDLVMKTDSLNDIQLYKEMFDTPVNVSSSDDKTVFNFNITRTE